MRFSIMADEQSQRKCVRLRIYGRVQGVWYRGWTQDNALVLNLNGWVRNRRDGSVEALIAGPSDAVEEMTRLCWRGPSFAEVRDIEILAEDALPPPGFEVLSTL